ncbi:outer membrane beta-barrel protein [Ferruginibacter sp. SUN106]|uniref:outer membrane beta-barrel protein n=1 Tax=Ferruginibacter sp. SUN106 TaxID=2978348 RepID=UPI003D366F5F
MQTRFLLKNVFILLFAGFISATAFGQNITLKGKVTDKADKTPVVGATIALVSQKDSAQLSLKVTDSKGNFQFSNLEPATYIVKISFSGYEKIEQKIALQASNKDAIPFTISKIATDLTGVTIISKAPPVKQKGDTSEFSASQFKVNPDATAEDMIKKLPGLTVAKDGTVTAMGEQVKKVTVDGKDFFGDDATAALKNLPADIIDKIQVFDKLSDQAALTGFDDGNSIKTVNIVTKSGIRNGQFGRIYAGAGTDGRYTAGGNVSFFNGNRRLSLVGNFNNINLQNFSSQDLLGVTSSGGGGGRGGGGRGGGGGFGGGADNFNVGQSSGISKTNAAGLNFSNVYGKKLTLTGSYFFNNSTNTNESLTNTETFYDPKNLFSLQKTNSTSDNTNHRINMRLEYKIDSANSLFIIPSISFQNNKSVSNSSSQNFYGINDSTSTSIGNSNSSRNGYNIRNNVMFRHSFPKRGRTISFGFNTNWTKNDGETITDAAYKFYKNGLVTDSLQNRFGDNSTNGTTIGGNIAYTEPIGKKSQLQIDYTPSVQKNKADQQTFNYDGQKYTVFDTSLSNRFDNTITTNNVGANFRLGQSRDEQLSFGVNFQNSKLESQRVFPTATSVHQTFSNILPNVMWRKKLSNVSNIRVFYRASTNFPSVSQLQDVVNLNNPLSVSSGNPDLKQSYTHFVTGRYSYTNSKTSKSFFANLLLQTASDYISNATYKATKDSTIQQNIVLKQGSQLSKPVNLDGYKSLRTFFTYSMPLKFIKTTLNVNTGFSYSKLPGLINNINTVTNSYAYNAGVVFASNISEYVDFNVSYSANFNNSTTNTTNSTATKYVNQAAGAQVNLLSKKGWFLQNDVSGNTYSGLSDGFNQSFWLWNAAIGKKILKKQAGEIKLSVFDLLKQNQSIVRTVTGAYIEDAQTQVLKQYFMLTFTYKLKNFGVAATRQGGNFNRGEGGMPGGGFGGGRPGGGGGF